MKVVSANAGNQVSARVSPDSNKVAAIKNADTPKTASQVRSFLGLTNYVSRFIANYARTTFVWSTETQQAFALLWFTTIRPLKLS